MNIGEAVAWQTVAGLLRGDLDHNDDATRESIAKSCAALDHRAQQTLGAGPASSSASWDHHLCKVATEDPS